MGTALVWLVNAVIGLMVWFIIIQAILSWLFAFDVINHRNRFVSQIADFLDRVTAPILEPFRRIIPPLGGIDISPNRKPIEPLKRMIEASRSAYIPVVWVNWGVRKDLLNISPSLQHAHNPHADAVNLASPVPGTRSEVIAKGSWGAEVVDEIHPGTADHQITKHRFSAFWDCETDAVLRNLGVRTLLIAGVNMDQCVMTTLEDATFLGYNAVLLEDCTATTSPHYCVQSVLYNVKLLFGFVAGSDAVLGSLADAEGGAR